MKGRWTIVALVASLALNLFVIGAAAGVVALGSRLAHERPAARAAMLRRAATTLTPDERRRFLQALRENALAARPTARQARGLRRDAWAALGDPKADPAAVKARLGQARTLDQANRARIEEAVTDFAAALPPGDRARFAAAIAASIPAPPPGQ